MATSKSFNTTASIPFYSTRAFLLDRNTVTRADLFEFAAGFDAITSLAVEEFPPSLLRQLL
ncbi:unnamed protein product [Ceratitis capitata]|uniref:(Mediterranean fruit fly) hypothetical protein n=1 Tax=Ceratitis capitata TaxID=7213 RepID=A0A811V8T4_CERCA|nr:unnamed protein product [Ceratitis capitata]